MAAETWTDGWHRFAEVLERFQRLAPGVAISLEFKAGMVYVGVKLAGAQAWNEVNEDPLYHVTAQWFVSMVHDVAGELQIDL